MAGRDVYVERVVNGARSERFYERLPEGTQAVILEEDDHLHVVLGTDEELAGVGLAKEKPKKKAPRKAAARKPAAKKSAAKRPARKTAARKTAAKK